MIFSDSQQRKLTYFLSHCKVVVFDSKFCSKMTHSSKHFQKEFHTTAPHISLSLFMQPFWKKSKYNSFAKWEWCDANRAGSHACWMISKWGCVGINVLSSYNVIVQVKSVLKRTVVHQHQFFSDLPSPKQSHKTNYWWFKPFTMMHVLVDFFF